MNEMCFQQWQAIKFIDNVTKSPIPILRKKKYCNLLPIQLQSSLSYLYQGHHHNPIVKAYLYDLFCSWPLGGAPNAYYSSSYLIIHMMFLAKDKLFIIVVGMAFRMSSWPN
jgi:hypothetical protein